MTALQRLGRFVVRTGGFAAVALWLASGSAAWAAPPLYYLGYANGAQGLQLLSPTGAATQITTFPSDTSPSSLVVAANGDILVGLSTAVLNGDYIQRVTPAGVVSTYATGFRGVSSLAFDPAGGLYVSEESGNRVTRITAGGVRSTFATLPGEAEDLAFDSNGVLFASVLAGPIYKVTPAGVVSQFTSRQIVDSQAVTIDATNTLFYSSDATVAKVTPAGVISTFGTASDGTTLFRGIVNDGAGNLFVSSSNTNVAYIDMFNSAGTASRAYTLPTTFRGSGLLAIAPEPSVLLAGVGTAMVTLSRGVGRRRR